MTDDVTPGRYRHFKGGEYEVVLVARDVETEEPVVVYQAQYGERGYWVRSLADFTSMVSRDGYEGVRFTRLIDQPRRGATGLVLDDTTNSAALSGGDDDAPSVHSL